MASCSCNVDLSKENCEIPLIQLLQSQGYAILSNHNVPTELLEISITQWKYFFNNEKKYDWVRTDNIDEGYIPFCVETAIKNTNPDYKELYQTHYGSKLPDIIDTTSTLTVLDNLVLLGERISTLIDSGLPSNIKAILPSSLASMSTNCGNHMLRIVHYPPILDDYSKQRAEAHTDICLFTFIFGKFIDGLELRDFQGNWFTPQCVDTDILIFTSEMLEISTNHYFKAITHRVPTNPKTCSISRYSIPFGFHPFRKSQLTKKMTAGQYLSQRLIEMGYDGTQLNQSDY